VRLSATAVEVLDGPQVVARHERVAGKHAEILVLDHYQEVLGYKPGALPGATALAQARTAGTFTLAHKRYWDAARLQHGDAAGTRALMGVARAPHLARRRDDPRGQLRSDTEIHDALPPSPSWPRNLSGFILTHPAPKSSLAI